MLQNEGKYCKSVGDYGTFDDLCTYCYEITDKKTCILVPIFCKNLLRRGPVFDRMEESFLRRQIL